MDSNNSTLVDTALALAKTGLPVFPCRPDDKVPCIKADVEAGKKIPKTGGFYKRNKDPDVIRQWWTEHPDAVIGYCPADLNLLGFDLDYGEGKAVMKAIAPHGRAFAYPTKSGGYHIGVRYPDHEEPGGRQSCWFAPDGAFGEIRYSRGYLIAWEPERLIADLEDGNGEPVPPEKIEALLLDRATATAAKKMLEAPRKERNDTLNAATYKARKDGADPERLRAVMRWAATLKGLTEDEVGRTLDSAFAADVAAKKRRPMRGRLLNDIEHQKAEFLYGQMFPMRSVSVIASPGGIGKSAIACYVAGLVAGAGGHVAIRAAEEDPEVDLKGRMMHLPTEAQRNILILDDPIQPGHWEDDWPTFTPRLFIVDPIRENTPDSQLGRARAAPPFNPT